MWLFGPRMTEEQKGRLREIANTMNSLADEQQASFERTSTELQQFGADCLMGQRAGLGRPATNHTESEVEAVRQLLKAHQETLVSVRGRLRAVELGTWVPDKVAKTRDEWDGFWETQSRFIDIALAGLAAPAPLVDRLGEAKLNMFLSGFSLAGTMARVRKRVKA